MADSDREDVLGFNDKRRVQGQTTTAVSSTANYVDVSALRARLTAINSTYYTTAKLNKMTKNDMVYAVRLSDDLAGVN